MMRITVATLMFGELPYFPFARRINEAYCTRYGYEFAVLGPCEDHERSPIWGKVSGVKTLLPYSDLVLFIDADAYFYDHSKSIETFIGQHMSDVSFVVGTDRRDRGFAWSDVNANTGVFLVRNNQEGVSIMEEWWSAPVRYDRRWLRGWPVEQGAFNYIVRQLFDERAIRVIPYWYINGRDGRYIRHLIAMTADARANVLKEETGRLIP